MSRIQQFLLLWSLLQLICLPQLRAQTPADSLPELTLEQLMQLRALGTASATETELNALIESASQRPFSTRETPNIVTVITSDEIRNSGARDLIDVLRLVPGIEFGNDVLGVVSIGIRGQWAAEGKMRVAIDGVEMNELMYGFFPFGNDFPVASIKRVEVIRGPGSVVNGGFAALGMINIITKDVYDAPGLTLSSVVGSTQTGFSRAGADVAWRSMTKDGWKIALRGNLSNALRSDQRYTDFYGNSVNLRESSLLQQRDASLSLSGNGLTVVAFAKFMTIQTNLGYDSLYRDQLFVNHFKQYRASATWNKKTHSGWYVNLNASYSFDRPWNTPTIGNFPPYERNIGRTRFNSSFRNNLTRSVSLAFGFQAFIDQAQAEIDSLPFLVNDSTRFSMRNQAVFAELTWKTYWFNLIVGGRIEYNSEYGSALVPRLALTKNFDQLSIKLLVNESFKAPTMENINVQDADGLEPELTVVSELEIGYKFGRKSYLTANLFRNDIRNPILYFVDGAAGEEFYTNGGRQSSWGTEAEFLYRDSLWQFRASWSFYSVRGERVAELYAVAIKPQVLLNFPQHKVTFSLTRLLARNWFFNTTGHFVSSRCLYTNIDAQGIYRITCFKPDALVSTTLNRRNLLPGVDFSISIHNLLNRRYVIGQPYSADLAPVSALSREFVVKFSWHPNVIN